MCDECIYRHTTKGVRLGFRGCSPLAFKVCAKLHRKGYKSMLKNEGNKTFNEHLEWSQCYYLEVFEAKMKSCIEKDDDDILLDEYKMMQRIYDVDDIAASLLIEYIDILDRCIKEECTKRWIRNEEIIDKRNSEVILGRFPAVVG